MKIKPIWIGRTVICTVILVLFLCQNRELSRKYNEGIGFAESGDYVSALDVMESIAEYRDAPEKTEEYQTEIYYQEGCELLEQEQWEEAQKKFELVISYGDYKDAKDKRYLALYEQARKLAFDGDVHSAELIYLRLPLDFMDVEARKAVIKENKKFAGNWKCTTKEIELKTQVYVDYDNMARIRAEMKDIEGFLLDEPVTLNGDGMEINVDRFYWAIYGDDSYSFVYSDGKYTVIRQPVVTGSQKYIFEKIVGVDYDALNSSYTSTEF